MALNKRGCLGIAIAWVWVAAGFLTDGWTVAATLISSVLGVFTYIVYCLAAGKS